jgi:PAS domain S-box-containing protein
MPMHTSVGQVPMERLRTIFDGMFDGVWLIGSDSRTTYVNEAMAGLLGTTTDAMHGHPITEYVSEEFQATAEAMIGRQPMSRSERVDMRFLRADGGDLWTLVAASPIVNADGSYVGSMLNVSDVTGKRAAQNQALQNQKLEAIGAFAAGISHDFNNLLTSIRGYTELAHAELPEGGIRADFDQVIASADRAQAITGRLLAFTRGQALQPIVVDPGRVLLDMLRMLRSLLSEDVEVVLDVEPGRTWVRIDPVALDQVLVNLAVNAQDAMHVGGTLTISMDEVEAHPAATPRIRFQPSIASRPPLRSSPSPSARRHSLTRSLARSQMREPGGSSSRAGHARRSDEGTMNTDPGNVDGRSAADPTVRRPDAVGDEVLASVEAQTWLDSDQTSADSDQTSSDVDQTTSEKDQSSVDNDRRASDRDQAVADRDRAADLGRSAANERAYVASRSDRQTSTIARLANRRTRAETDRDRDQTATRRDRIAAARDDAVRERDARVGTLTNALDHPDASITSSPSGLAWKPRTIGRARPRTENGPRRTARTPLATRPRSRRSCARLISMS